jgi:DNA-directed RNA polymerase specialized sigma24 family protein
MTADPTVSIGHDPQAFESFYRTYVDDVLRFIARRVNDPHLAADRVTHTVTGGRTGNEGSGAVTSHSG